MALKANQIAFLRNYLTQPVVERGILHRRTADERAHDEAANILVDFQRRRDKVVAALGELTGVPGGDKIAARFRTAVADAEKVLAAVAKDDFATLKTKADEQFKQLEQVKEDAREEAKVAKDYAKKKGETDVLYQTLKTAADGVKLPDAVKQFHEPVQKILETAATKANEGFFRSAMLQLEDGAKLQRETLPKVTELAAKKTKFDVELPKAKVLQKKLAIDSSALGEKIGATARKPLDDLIGEAEKFIAAGTWDYVKACETIAAAPAKDTEIRKDLKKKKEQQLEGAKDKPQFEANLQRLESALAELKNLPGAEASWKVLEKNVAVAKSYLGKEETEIVDFANLTRLLGEPDKVIQDVRQKSQGFMASPQMADFQKARLELTTAVAGFKNVGGLGFPDKVAAGDKVIADAMKAVAQGGTGPELKKLVDTMKKTAGEVTAEAKTFTDRKTECEKISEELRPTIYGQLKKAAPAAEYQKVFQDFDTATALLGSQRYEMAKTKLDDLKKVAVGEGLKKFIDAEKKWTDLVGAFNKDTKIADTANMAVTGPLAKLAKKLQQDFRVLEAKALQTHDFTAGSTGLDALVKQADGLRARVDGMGKANLDKYTAALGKVETDVQKLRTDVENGKLKALKDKGGDVAAQDAEIVNAITHFSDMLNEAPDEKLDEWATKTTEYMKGRFKAIEDNIDKVLNDPAQLKTAVDSAINKEVKLTFAAELRNASELLDMLEIENVTNRGALADKVKAVKGEYDKQLAKGQLTRQVVDSLKIQEGEIEKALDANRSSVDGTAAKASGVAAQVKADIDKIAKDHRKHNALVQSLRSRLAECEGMIESKMLPSIKEAEKKLGDLKFEVAASLDDNNDLGINKLKKRIVDFKNEIKNPILKECLPSQFAVFEKRLDDSQLPKDCNETTTVEAKKLLDAFKQDLDHALERAKSNKDLRVKLKTEAEALEIQLGEEPLKSAAKLAASLKQQLKSVKEPGENAEASGLFQINRVKRVLTDVTPKKGATPDEAKAAAGKLETEEKKVVQAEADAEKLAKKWLGAKAVFENTDSKQAETKYKEVKAARVAVNEDLYKRINEIYLEAKEKIAKTNDYDGAFSKLNLARQAAAEFLSDPLDARDSARNKLREINNGWKSAVSQFVQSVSTLEAAIIAAAAADPADKPVAENAKDVLDTLLQVFDPARFDKVVTELTNKGIALPAVRSWKEMGLRYLRESRKDLAGHKIIEQAVQNPFGVAIPIAGLDTSLRNLELALLRA